MWYNKEFWFDIQNYYNFFPLKGQTIEERANAIYMFSLYLSIVLSVLKQNFRYMFILLVGIIISVSYVGGGGIGTERLVKYQKMLQENQIDEIPNENKDEIIDVVKGKVCTQPTQDNPYMNWLNGDDMDKKEACSLDNVMVKEKARQIMDQQVYRTTGDIWGRNPIDRWYTMPNNGKVPNDMGDYIDYLYGDLKTPRCKEMSMVNNNRSQLIAGAQCYKQTYKFIPPQ